MKISEDFYPLCFDSRLIKGPTSTGSMQIISVSISHLASVLETVLATVLETSFKDKNCPHRGEWGTKILSGMHTLFNIS